MQIAISGAGIAGLSAALALTKFIQPSPPTITVIEIRPQPGAIGGAINLTPKCQRYLHHLGVHARIQKYGYGADVHKLEFLASDTGLIGTLDCCNEGKGYGNPPYNCLRILRSNLIKCLTETVAEHTNITIKYGVQIDSLSSSESPSGDLTLTLSDKTNLQQSLLLGCDGVHSTTRLNFVEPTRLATYTGCCGALGFAAVTPSEKTKLPFQDTCIVFAQRGRFFCSYYNTTRDAVFLGALLNFKAEDSQSRDGWMAKGADRSGLRKVIAEQFDDTKLMFVKEFIERADEWFLYPAYTLSAGGKWVGREGRVVLLGDAAHAMPPQGESAGYAIEDTVVYARVLAKMIEEGVEAVNLGMVAQKYAGLRREKIDAAFVEAKRRWSGADRDWWVTYKLKTWLLPMLMRFLAGKTKKAWEEDFAVGDIF